MGTHVWLVGGYTDKLFLSSNLTTYGNLKYASFSMPFDPMAPICDYPIENTSL